MNYVKILKINSPDLTDGTTQGAVGGIPYLERKGRMPSLPRGLLELLHSPVEIYHAEDTHQQAVGDQDQILNGGGVLYPDAAFHIKSSHHGSQQGGPEVADAVEHIGARLQ